MDILPKHHKKAFEYAHQNFLLKTVHAGELLVQRVFSKPSICLCRSIGTWVSFVFSLIKSAPVRFETQAAKEAYVESLIRYVSNRRLTIEVCISSNMQTNPEIPSVKTITLPKC